MLKSEKSEYIISSEDIEGLIILLPNMFHNDWLRRSKL